MEAAVEVRKIIVKSRGKNGLFPQPKTFDPVLEQHNRDRAANHANYADQFTGNTRTSDKEGNYVCGDCNMFTEELDGKEDQCLFVDIPKVDDDNGSCRHWENRCASDPEMKLAHGAPRLARESPEQAAYGTNPGGFGCWRCPYADQAHEVDSVGRSLWCGVWYMRVFPDTSCCDKNAAGNKNPFGGASAGGKSLLDAVSEGVKRGT